MKIRFLTILVATLILGGQQAHAQQIWDLLSEPSDERLPQVKNEISRGWACYGLRNGLLRDDCPVTFRHNAIGGPNVVEACSPGSSGSIGPLTCGNGGHTHDETDRPILFPGTEVQYPPGLPNTDPLFVSGPSPSSFTDLFTWTVSQVSGYYTFDATMTAPPNTSFWLFEQGVFTKTQVLEAVGRVNVTVDRDTMKQLADIPFFYDKARNQNASAVTHTDPVAFAATLKTRMALTAIGRAFKNDTGSNISYNDISLPKGGLFDWLAVHPLGGTDRPWATPHSSHRRGTDADVNKPGNVPCTQNTSVQKAVDSILSRSGSNKTALVCETSNFGNYHIIVDQLKIPQAFQTIFIF